MELRRDIVERIRAKVASAEYDSPDDLVAEALDALEHEQKALERERDAIREELDRRCDDLKSGAVKPVPGKQAFAGIRRHLDANRP